MASEQNSIPIVPYTLPLDSDQAFLARVGGKGANLSRLVRAGFPVPPGFLVTTRAYRQFVHANQLGPAITSALQQVDLGEPGTLENASLQIRSLFSGGDVPVELGDSITAAYRQLNAPADGQSAVAVRSSATAEDLPDLSFAGQQDTYLNVIGAGSLLQAVVACWGSLWTARAIGYRARSAVPHSDAALAVVVQVMVESEVAGVMFTANPLSGLRTETVIDAAFGLGEALVSGQVEPDHYVVSSVDGRILSKKYGAKKVSIHAKAGGGTLEQVQERAQVQALPDDRITALAELGQQVADLYQFPQDIEWAWSQDRFFLLQSRPVTSLFPLPEGLPAEPLRVFFSFAAVQGMLDPITPLGRDTIKEIFSAGGRLFGIKVTRETQTALYAAGERLWINFTPIITNSVGRKLVPAVFGLIEPSVRQAIESIWNDSRLQPRKPGISFSARMKMARFFLPLAANVLLNLAAPNRRRKYIVETGEQRLRDIKKQSGSIQGDRWQKLAQRAGLLPNFAARKFTGTFLLFVSGVAAGMASWNFLNRMAEGSRRSMDDLSSNGISDLVLQVTRGMPHNPTSEMDLALWDIAKTIRNDPDSLRMFKELSSAELAAQFLADDLTPGMTGRISRFLDRYGGRGLAEIDLGRTRWAKDPTYIFETLKSYLQIEDQTQTPDAVFARGAVAAHQAIDQLAAAVRKTPLGWIKAGLVRFLAGRARQLMGLRESPKFFAVRLFWLLQEALLESGWEFTQAGELDRPDDLFYLSYTELHDFAARQDRDWRALIVARRQDYERESLRKQVPRLMLSDGRAFYAGLEAADSSGDELTGSPVSPGSVEGRVRVVLDPTQAGLLPGEILVCPGTDPSWTPLFLSAAGLVMEVGGMMTHGAVVAREYGIPAVVGVDKATQRLRTGQLIRMDGSNGQIEILPD